MTAIRRPFALSAAAGALLFGGFAAAQPMPAPGPSPEMTYEYAVAPQPGAVVYRANPVVQPIPAPPPPPPAPMAVPVPPPPPDAAPVAEWRDPRGPDYRTDAYAHGPVAAYGNVPPPGYAPPPQFDRDGWLADCHERIRGIRSEDERASIIGGLLGAAAGGVIGHRVYDSHRTAGALIGAGVGGLAGLAIGAAIDVAGKRRHGDECAAYLERYSSGEYGNGGYLYGGNAYGAGYPGYPGYGYAYVPVLVAVPQRQVVREYVTEEWVDVPVRTVTRTRVIRERTPAPRHDKRIKIIKR